MVQLFLKKKNKPSHHELFVRFCNHHWMWLCTHRRNILILLAYHVQFWFKGCRLQANGWCYLAIVKWSLYFYSCICLSFNSTQSVSLSNLNAFFGGNVTFSLKYIMFISIYIDTHTHTLRAIECVCLYVYISMHILQSKAHSTENTLTISIHF